MALSGITRIGLARIIWREALRLQHEDAAQCADRHELLTGMYDV